MMLAHFDLGILHENVEVLPGTTANNCSTIKKINSRRIAAEKHEARRSEKEWFA
jgi:hypothetical protein